MSKSKVYPNPSQKTITLNVMLGDIWKRYPPSVMMSLNSKGQAQLTKEIKKLISVSKKTMANAKDGDSWTISTAGMAWGVAEHMLYSMSQLGMIAASEEAAVKEFRKWLKDQKFEPVEIPPLHPPIGSSPSDKLTN